RRPEYGVEADAARRGDGHCDLGARADLGVQLFARFGIQLLGIVEPPRHARGVEDDGGGNDRTGERSPARFVAAGDRPHPAFEGGALATEGWTDVFLAERQTHDADFPGASRDCASGGRAIHGAMVRAAASKSTGLAFPLWRTGKRVWWPSPRQRKYQNRVSCSAARRGGLKCSVVSRVRVLLKPNFSQATSKRRPIIQATGPAPIMRVFQLES